MCGLYPYCPILWIHYACRQNPPLPKSDLSACFSVDLCQLLSWYKSKLTSSRCWGTFQGKGIFLYHKEIFPVILWYSLIRRRPQHTESPPLSEGYSRSNDTANAASCLELGLGCPSANSLFHLNNKANCLFSTGNVYFDVRSRGDRYGKLTNIYSDAQEELGKLKSYMDFYSNLNVIS